MYDILFLKFLQTRKFHFVGPKWASILFLHIISYRDVPSSAAFPIIRPALGRQHSISDRAKVAMRGYLNHFLGNLDIVNSEEVLN